jgi:hypothetical protein
MFFVTNHYQMRQACGNGNLSIFYFNYFACFINKEMVQQHKLALVKKNIVTPIKVINNCSFSLRLVTHETKAFEVKC